MTSSIQESVLKAYEKIETQYNKRDEMAGIASGFYELDNVLSGFQKSELTILAARHSMGKTAFALNMVQTMINNEVPVLFVSYEMNNETITKRMLCSNAEVDNLRIKTGCLQRKDWDKLANSMQEICEKGENVFHLLASCNLTFKFLADEIRAFAEKNGNGIIMIDYFQLIKLEEKYDRIVELSSLACDIKRLAVEINMPIILLSQISKKCEERKDRRPQVVDLSECDALAQHSDNIIFIYRDDYYINQYDEDCTSYNNHGKTEIIIAKQKNGPIGSFDLLFQANIAKFKNPIKTDIF